MARRSAVSMSANDGSVFDRYHGAWIRRSVTISGPVAVHRVPDQDEGVNVHPERPRAVDRLLSAVAGLADAEGLPVSKNVTPVAHRAA